MKLYNMNGSCMTPAAMEWMIRLAHNEGIDVRNVWHAGVHGFRIIIPRIER